MEMGVPWKPYSGDEFDGGVDYELPFAAKICLSGRFFCGVNVHSAFVFCFQMGVKVKMRRVYERGLMGGSLLLTFVHFYGMVRP